MTNIHADKVPRRGFGVAGSVPLIVVFAVYLQRAIVRPVLAAAAMAGQLAGGDLAARMLQTGVGEIGALQRSFNTMAVSLQHSRAELAASRARIVAAADQTRRRIERDLHDGIQQRLVSHGTGDRVLPVDACSRRLVPRLRALDDQVAYEEFDGGHEVPDEVVNLAVSWMLSGNGAVRT